MNIYRSKRDKTGEDKMKYRKKPIVIEAFQMTEETREDNTDWPGWLNEAWNKVPGFPGSLWPAARVSDSHRELRIATLEGMMDVSWGDYIIQGINGEIYPCKPDIFLASYEVSCVCEFCGAETEEGEQCQC